ncbi:hypothetical protein D3C87_1786520 [compost metagenome]
MQAYLTHLLAETRHFAIGYRHCRIRRDITTRRACSAGGQHQMAAHFVHQLAQGLLDYRLFIRDQTGLQFKRCGERGCQPLFQSRDAFIGINAAGRAVRNRH